MTHAVLAATYLQQNRCDPALAEARSIPLSFPNYEGAIATGYANGRCGHRDEALGMVRELEDRATREFVIPQRLALFYLGLGDTEKAIAWLQRAFEQRIPNFMALTREPAYDALRGDPRFIRLVSRIGVNP